MDCFNLWSNNLDCIISYLYYETEYGEKPDYKNPSKFRNNKGFIEDTILVLNFFMKDPLLNDIHKDRKLCDAIGKILAYELFAHVPNSSIVQLESQLVELLNFINWNCDVLFQYGEVWMSDLADFGYDFAYIMNLAKKYDKVITSYDKKTIIHGLFSMVYYCNNTDADYAEKFIINNNIKLKDYVDNMDNMNNPYDEFNSLRDEMVDYFKGIGYEL